MFDSWWAVEGFNPLSPTLPREGGGSENKAMSHPAPGVCT